MESTNDIFTWIFWIGFFIFCGYFFRKWNRTNLPTRTEVSLPNKIHFVRNSDNDYGVGTFLLDVVTIGGHGRLKEARYHYENEYSLYAFNFNKSIDLRRSINDQLNNLGEYTFLIINELEKSRKLLNRPKNKGMDYNQLAKFTAASDHISQLKTISESKANTGIILLQGSTLGGLAAVGSWTMVSLLGTASTGTAIASLSGVAAHNAILAWFGGGALAAGGGGMAAGALTLGAIVAAPIVIFSAYKTHSKATVIEAQTKGLIPEVNKLELSNAQLMNMEKIAKDQVSILQHQYEKLQKVNQSVYKIIYPNGLFSEIKRSMDEFLNKNYYTKREAAELDQLLQAIGEAYILLSQEQSTTPLQLTSHN